MMSVTVTDDVWSLDYAVNTYKQIKELEGYVLWKAKQEFEYGDFTKFCKEINISETKVRVKISYFEALKSLSIQPPAVEFTEDIAIDIITDKTNPVNKISESTYTELKGNTPQEKVEFYEEVTESIIEEQGKYRPSRQDIRDYKNKDEILTEKEAIAQTNKEYETDYYTLCGGGFSTSMGVLNIGFEIHKFDDDWKEIKKILANAAHTDKGGSKKAMQFVSVLNMIFRDKKKDAKEQQLKKDMTARIVSLMGKE